MSKDFFKKVHVYIIAIFSIMFWGMSYIWANQLLELGIPVEFFIPIRCLIAGLILLAVNLIMRIPIKVHKEDGVMLFLLAMCEPFIYFFCETYGIKLTGSPTLSALIIASTPIVAALAGRIFFKEKMTLLNVVGILICVGGLTMVSGGKGTVGTYFIFGIVVLLIAVFAEVGHASCTKALSERHYPPTVIVMYQFLIGTAYFIPLFLTRGVEKFDAALYLSWDCFRPILFLSVLCSSLCFSLWVFAIKKLGVSGSSVFLAMIPVATALWGILLGDEKLKLLQWIGLAVSIGGLLLAQKKPAEKESQPALEEEAPSA
jgi:drug/metabolite transporter (DMT)-like permease